MVFQKRIGQSRLQQLFKRFFNDKEVRAVWDDENNTLLSRLMSREIKLNEI